MQWYHYLNTAVVGGILAYWYYRTRDQLSQEERKEFDAAMALEEPQEAPQPNIQQRQEQGEQEELEEPEEGQVRDPAAALAQRQAENEPVQLNSWKNREVGAKKARSLALKAQRRNYSEYMEEQARTRREMNEIEEEMYGDMIAAERAQRELRSEQARLKLEEQQRVRREAEERERKAQAERQASLKRDVAANGYAKIKNDDDKELISELGTITGNGEYVVGGPKVLQSMKQALVDGEASWSRLVQL